MSPVQGKRTIVQVMETRVEKHGSYEDFMVRLAVSCRAKDIDLHFVLPDVRTESVRAAIEAEGARVWTVKEGWKTLAGAKAMIRVFREIGPDVADVHYNGAGPFLLVHLYCLANRIPVSIHYHGEIRPIPTLRWRNRHASTLRLLAWFVRRYITVSHANAGFLRALNVTRPIEVIYNGVDVEQFRRRLQPRRSSETVRLISIGSIIPRKRVDVLLRAIDVVRRTSPNIHLTIVGGGSEEVRCKKLAEDLGLSETVTFAGLLKDYPYDLLSAADIFVSASESESFGLMFAEAMCFELPVVACEVGGVPEVVLNESTGILVPPDDAEEFANAVLRLVNDPELRQRMGEIGLKHVRESFELADRTNDVIDLLNRDIESRRGPARSTS